MVDIIDTTEELKNNPSTMQIFKLNMYHQNICPMQKTNKEKIKIDQQK